MEQKSEDPDDEELLSNRDDDSIELAAMGDSQENTAAPPPTRAPPRRWKALFICLTATTLVCVVVILVAMFVALHSAVEASGGVCDALLGIAVNTKLCLAAHPDQPAVSPRAGALHSFIVVGDWGRDGWCCQHDVAYEMARTAERMKSSYIISVGDNFYPSGLGLADNPQVNTSWHDVYISPFASERLGRLQWIVALGNHDYRGSVGRQLAMHGGQWYMPRRYFDRVVELAPDVSMHLIVIDTNPMIPYYRSHSKYKHSPDGVRTQNVSEQVQWLQQTLERSTHRWKVVIGHHPIYTFGKHRGEDEGALARLITPLIEAHAVAVYIAGHDHDMQFIRMPNQRAYHIVSGAGSKIRPSLAYRSAAQDGELLFSAQMQGFNSISLARDEMHIDWVSFEGKLLSNHTIRHPSLR